MENEAPRSRLVHVGVRATALERTIVFWRDGLGLRVVEAAPGRYDLSDGYHNFRVFQHRGPVRPPHVGGLLDYLHVGVRVPDLAEVAQRLTALDAAVQRQCPHGSRDHGLHLMSDNGGQPTAVAFMKTAAMLGITQAFTSSNTPKGNADTERLMRTLKEELLWLRDRTSAVALEQALAAWVEWYNTHYWHSALGYRTPCQVEQQDLLSHSTQFVAA
ncbi:MAG: hypothetical protein C4294_09690 [Nitrospiraceae bacterium]